MKKKNGFTIIEVTVSITLILLLAILVVPNLFDMGDSAKEKMYDTKIELALNGAYKYGKENIDELSDNCTGITIGSLISKGYITGDDVNGDNLVDPITEESMNNIIICVYYIDREVRVSLK